MRAHQHEGPAWQPWNLRRTMAETGLSKTTLYREIAAGRFPPQEKYEHVKKVFWKSEDVIAWKSKQGRQTRSNGLSKPAAKRDFEDFI